MRRVSRRNFILVPAFGAVLGAFFLLVVFAFSLLQEQADNLRQRTYDETGIAAVQLRLHYEKLMGSLAEVEHHPDDDTVDGAIMEFDILFERVRALPTRPSYEFLLDDEMLAVQKHVLAVLQEMVPRVDQAADGDAQALFGMRFELSKLRLDFERLANNPVQRASERRAALTENFSQAGVWFGWTIVGLVIAGLAFTGIIWWQFKLAAGRETTLKELAISFEQARDDAEAASRAKSDFLSHMSHELRTPMNAILGFAQILELGRLDDKQKMAVSQILNSGKLLLHLIDQVLEMNRLAGNRIAINSDPVDIQDVVHESMALVSKLADDRGVETSVEFPDAVLPTLYSDHNRVKQILVNLLSNAVKYNHPGGHAGVRISQGPEGHIRFIVFDDGDGIPLELQSEIFQPFNRLGRESQNIEGTGIGMTIVSDLVQKLGGQMDFTSTPGEGSSFWFDLPFAPQLESHENRDE